MRTKLFITGLCMAALISAPALANTTTEDFVRKAAIANEFEIQSSKIALDKSQNDTVKEFAQRMVDDHGKTGDRFKEAVSASTSDVKPMEGLDDKHQKMIDKLNSADAKNFDKQYVKMQTDAHKQAVSLFGDYAKNGKDETLKEFASETLPHLESHLVDVKKLKM